MQQTGRRRTHLQQLGGELGLGEAVKAAATLALQSHRDRHPDIPVSC